jgi:uncharacterized membrane protein
VTIGVCVAIVYWVSTVSSGKKQDFAQTRLILARYLSLALEFQLGADILGTAVSPSWDHIGKLAAVAVIRTGLNYFLMMEMKAQDPTNNQAAKPTSAEASPTEAEP